MQTSPTLFKRLGDVLVTSKRKKTAIKNVLLIYIALELYLIKSQIYLL